MGRRLIPLLARRGNKIKALVRPGSENKLPDQAQQIVGDALRAESYSDNVAGADTFVHLIGVPHPSPKKAVQFREVDLVSIQAAVGAARNAGVKHFIYLSVAHPASMMKEYIAVRTEGEALLRASGMSCTFVRPWYVLGPGHRWPLVLLPLYWVCELLPRTRDGARRLGLVTLGQMLNALLWSVENQPRGIQIIDVPAIRRFPRELP